MTHAVVRYGTVDLTSVPPRGKRLETAGATPTASHRNGLGLLMLHHKGLYTVNCFSTRTEPVS
jgi:hypothetical protein